MQDETSESVAPEESIAARRRRSFREFLISKPAPKGDEK